MRSYVFIPARAASTRLPNKLLLNETGKSVLQHTYEACKTAKYPLGVMVAAADRDIFSDVQRFGGNVVLIDDDLPSGTDRIARMAESYQVSADIIVNVQADEPEIRGSDIDLVIRMLEIHPRAQMATLATEIRSSAQFLDPSCVKVVTTESGRALYFSRSPIPWSPEICGHGALQHLGIYAYRRDYLLAFSHLPASTYQGLESLEQLRALEAGWHIQVAVVAGVSRGIDTLEDYQAFCKRQQAVEV